jgi:hypothetical protein
MTVSYWLVHKQNIHSMPRRSQRESKQDYQLYNAWGIWNFALSFHQKKTWGKIFLIVMFVCFEDENALNSWPELQSIHKHFIRSQRLFREFPDWLPCFSWVFHFPWWINQDNFASLLLISAMPFVDAHEAIPRFIRRLGLSWAYCFPTSLLTLTSLFNPVQGGLWNYLHSFSFGAEEMALFLDITILISMILWVSDMEVDLFVTWHVASRLLKMGREWNQICIPSEIGYPTI